MKKIFVVVVLAFTLQINSLLADEYLLDPVHTQIIFFADHLGFS
ncbi:MAG: hypothetical protein AAGB35_03090 [Pseudomonadota bacterium]